ncbi:VPLPA-CTERM sorting domain-containing protein [Roseobacter sp. A03A-229]
MTRYTTLCAALVAALTALSTPLAAKTISFTAALESESYMGTPSPFSEQPATLDVVIELNDDPGPVDGKADGNGISASYTEAVASFAYEAFGALGNSIGAWSASNVVLTIDDFLTGDSAQFFSQETTGPEPLDWMLLLFEGDANLWASNAVDNLTTDTLKAMTTTWIDLYTIAGDGAIGARFAVNPDSIVVTDPNDPIDPNPAPVPLPAGLPLLLSGLGAFGWVRRGRVVRTSDKAVQA